jgi:hypothetical protein
MSDQISPDVVDLELGQPVNLRTEPGGRIGYIVGIMLVPPHEALVRWRDAEVTFETLDDLVEAAPQRV